MRSFITLTLLLAVLCMDVSASFMSVGIAPDKKSLCIAPNEDSMTYFFISAGPNDGNFTSINVKSKNESIARTWKSCPEDDLTKCTFIYDTLELRPSTGRNILIQLMPLPVGLYQTNIIISGGAGSATGMGTYVSTSASLSINVSADCSRVFERVEVNKTLMPVCGDGWCEESENHDRCPQDCNEAASWWWLYLLLILLVVAVVAGILYYRHTH